MDLKTFVSETLTQIVAGVKDAQEQIEALGTNAQVNPHWVYEKADNKAGEPSAVEFDVALIVVDQKSDTQSDKLSGRAKGGILSVFTAEIGSELAESRSGQSRAETVSRVKFKIALAQPSHIHTYSGSGRSRITPSAKGIV